MIELAPSARDSPRGLFDSRHFTCKSHPHTSLVFLDTENTLSQAHPGKMSLLQQLDQLPPPPYSHQQPFNDLKLPDLPADHIINSSPPQLPTLEPLLSLNMIPNGFDSQANTLPKPLSVHSRSDIKSVQLPRIHSLIPGDLSSPTDVTSVATIDEYTRRRGPSVSTQDADDRMAAEALCGLGKVGTFEKMSKNMHAP